MGLVAQASLPLGLNLKLATRPFSSRQTAVPLLTSPATSFSSPTLTAVALYSAERRAILLEHLGPDLLELSASQRLFWAGSLPSGPPSNGLSVLVRPSAP